MMIYLLLVFLVLSQAAIRQTPVIGIYTQDAEYPGYESQTYIAASYVKIIQSAGGQVVPIFYSSTEAELATLLPQINGVLFPGGQMPIDIRNHWTSNIAYILNWATKQNNNGRVFPIWGTCLGYQAIAVITSMNSNNMSTLTEVHGEQGASRKLSSLDKNSTLFKDMPKQVLNKIQSDQGVYYFHHTWAVLTLTFKRSPTLTSFWNLVSTSISPSGQQFVSTLEAKKYPFFMTQYHPEKNSFQWRVPATRTYEAIFAELRLFNIFIEYARKSTNSFKDPNELSRRLIWNYNATYTTPDYAFVQIYLFNEDAQRSKFSVSSLRRQIIV